MLAVRDDDSRTVDLADDPVRNVANGGDPIADGEPRLGCVDAHEVSFGVFGDQIETHVCAVALRIHRHERCRRAKGLHGRLRQQAVAKVGDNHDVRLAREIEIASIRSASETLWRIAHPDRTYVFVGGANRVDRIHQGCLGRELALTSFTRLL